MAETIPEIVVTSAMQHIATIDAPPALRANIQRHSEKLLELAITLLNSGMDEQKVRSIVDQACSSYRDELITAILALRDRHEN